MPLTAEGRAKANPASVKAKQERKQALALIRTGQWRYSDYYNHAQQQAAQGNRALTKTRIKHLINHHPGYTPTKTHQLLQQLNLNPNTWLSRIGPHTHQQLQQHLG